MAKDPSKQPTQAAAAAASKAPRWAIIRSVSPMGSFRRAGVTFEKREVTFALNEAAAREVPSELLSSDQWKRIRAESMLAYRETDDPNEAAEAAAPAPEITTEDLKHLIYRQGQEIEELRRELALRAPAPADARVTATGGAGGSTGG